MVNDIGTGLWVSIFLLRQQLVHYRRLSLQDIDRCAVFDTGVVFCVSIGSCMPVCVNESTTCARFAYKMQWTKDNCRAVKRTLNRLPKLNLKGCTLRLVLTVKQQRFNVSNILHRKFYSQP